MANFEVDTEQRPGEVVVRLSGDLDLAAFDAVDEMLANGNRCVRIDLRGLDSSIRPGNRVLLAAHTWAERNGQQFCIIRGGERIQRVFALTGLDGRPPFCDDET